MKKCISAVLAAVMILFVIYIPSSALKGKWDSVIWEINDGVLTVSGGDIPDSAADSAAPWMKFADKITRIVVGNGVKTVGIRAFEDMNCVVSAELGGAVNIGEMAFSGCTSLKEVSLPESVTVIGDHAFAECVALKKVTLPSSVTSIGEGVWEACPSLVQIDSNSARYYSDNGVLMDKASAAVLRYPPAKSGSYISPAGVTAVAEGAFRDCVYLESASLSEVQTIGDGAFYGCLALSDISIPAAKQIGRAAFYGCASLEEIEFGASLARIGGNAFSYCESLGTADFAGNAPEAEVGIFYGCDGSFTVVIGKNSTGFGESQWLGYPVLRHGNYSGEAGGIKWSLDSSTGVMTLTGTDAIPDYEYASDAPWYEYRKLIRELNIAGVTGIGANSFRYSSLRTVELPESVKSVGAWAFSGCGYLENVTVSGQVDIGECAFFGNTDLEWVKIESTKSIGKQAFSGCESLKWVFTEITAPTLGEYAFDGTDAAVLYPVGGTGYSGGEWANVYSEAYTPGDANGDGKCNTADVTLLMKYVAKWDVEVKRVSADTNLDGKLNITDVSNTLKHIAKWDIVIGFDKVFG